MGVVVTREEAEFNVALEAAERKHVVADVAYLQALGMMAEHITSALQRTQERFPDLGITSIVGGYHIHGGTCPCPEYQRDALDSYTFQGLETSHGRIVRLEKERVGDFPRREETIINAADLTVDSLEQTIAHFVERNKAMLNFIKGLTYRLTFDEDDQEGLYRGGISIRMIDKAWCSGDQGTREEKRENFEQQVRGHVKQLVARYKQSLPGVYVVQTVGEILPGYQVPERDEAIPPTPSADVEIPIKPNEARAEIVNKFLHEFRKIADTQGNKAKLILMEEMP